jgi:hypothetical protein
LVKLDKYTAYKLNKGKDFTEQLAVPLGLGERLSKQSAVGDSCSYVEGED